MSDDATPGPAALREALARAEDARTAERLCVAIAHAHGVSQAELARWYGRSRKTIHNWVARFEDGPGPLAAARDAPRPGRPARLTDAQRAELRAALADSPENADEWTGGLVADFVEREFGVDYAASTGRRLIRELRDE